MAKHDPRLVTAYFATVLAAVIAIVHIDLCTLGRVEMNDFKKDREAAMERRLIAYELALLGWLLCALAFVCLFDQQIPPWYSVVTAVVGFVVATVGFQCFRDYQRRIARLPTDRTR